MHFQNAGAPDSNTAWLSSGVPNMLVTGLAQTRGLEIVSERRLLEALGQSSQANLSSLGRTQAADVARRAGAGAIVVGSIFHAGPEIRIDAQVEDLATGRVLGAQTVRGTDVFALVDQLAAEIRDVVGFGDSPDVRNVANVSSTSLEAYRLLLRRHDGGVERADGGRREITQGCRGHRSVVRRGVSACLRTSAATSEEERSDSEYFKLALDNAERLSERHRLLLDIAVARERGNVD